MFIAERGMLQFKEKSAERECFLLLNTFAIIIVNLRFAGFFVKRPLLYF